MICLTQEEFINKCIQTHGKKYDYSKTVYTRAIDNIIIICSTHGEFEQNARDHSRGNGCKKCRKGQTMDENLFIERCSSIHDYKYEYSLVKYAGTTKKIDIICPVHGVFSQLAGAHLHGVGCIKCADDAKHNTFSYFIDKSIEKHGDIFDYRNSNYINNNTKINILCKKCKKYFQRKPKDHLSGNSCPNCRSSKGENAIERFLLENNIKHQRQYRFTDCRGARHPLPFDFAVFDDDILKYLIEYDGEQHFNSKQYGEISLENTRRRDKIKNDYCEENNIKLIRIPYTEFKNIDKILSDSEGKGMCRDQEYMNMIEKTFKG